jgi:hypothetical protein
MARRRCRLSPFHRVGEGQMLRIAASKVAWVGRTTSVVFGLALVMALVFGVATMAMGATGGNFLLGKKNVADAISTLVKQGPGPALSLVVEDNQPPLKVNATAGKATNLNADKVDGLTAEELRGPQGATGPQGPPGPPGLSGYQQVNTLVALENSAFKSVEVSCPSGKRLLGGGYGFLNGAASNQTIEWNGPKFNTSLPIWRTAVFYDFVPLGSAAQINVYAICATVAN